MKAILSQEIEFTYAAALKGMVKKAFAGAKRFHEYEVPIKFGNNLGYLRLTYDRDENKYDSYISLKNEYLLKFRTQSEVYSILSNELL